MRWVARQIVGRWGGTECSKIGTELVHNLNETIDKVESTASRSNHSSSLRRILRSLREDYGANKLEHLVKRTAVPRPRNVTATSEERQKLLDVSPPNVRLWLLLCSDMAIRSGTAALITPAMYDPKERTITYTTKYDAKQCLPVTAEVAFYLDTPNLKPNVPYVAQLERGNKGIDLQPLGHMHPGALGNRFQKIKKEHGIRPELRPHDLRRTTAVRVYDQTRDLRVVQKLLGHSSLASTLWYLDHHTATLDRQTLELAKLNTTKETIQ